MYNHSLFSADRSTHLKIVLVPVITAALLVVAAVNLRLGDAGTNLRADRNPIVRAGHAPSLYADSASVVIR